MIRRNVKARLATAAVVLLVACAWSVGVAVGQPVPATNPTITLDRSTARVGDRILVQFHNWRSAAVTISVCGNLARRGSVDCNIVAGEGVPISRLSPETLEDFVVPVPPTTCPCAIRASNSDQTEIGYAPITLTGVPTRPLTSPSEFSPLDTTVDVRRVHSGLGGALQSALGGPTTYDVAVTLRNKSADNLIDVRPYGWGGRSKTDQSRPLNFPAIGGLGPGQSWTHVFRVRTPAPHLGRYYWEVSVSGVEAPVQVESVTRDTPWLLIALVALIFGDVTVIVVRRIKRRSSAICSVPPELSLMSSPGLPRRSWS